MGKIGPQMLQVGVLVKRVVFCVAGLIFCVGAVNLVLALVKLFQGEVDLNAIIASGGAMVVSLLVSGFAHYLAKHLRELQDGTVERRVREFREETIADDAPVDKILRRANQVPRSIAFPIMSRIFVAGFFNQFSCFFQAAAAGVLALFLALIDEFQQTQIKMILASSAIWPVIGLGLIAASMGKAYQRLQLARSGIIAPAKLVGRQRTNASINERTVFRMKFEFEDQDGQIQHCTVSSHTPEQYSDSETEYVLYAPNKVGDAITLKSVPSEPLIAKDGSMHASTSTKPLVVYLIAPALAFATTNILLIVIFLWATG
ncbi:MAG: hypothetical protein CMJ78_21515 [Planctomycetaceae bacterium]|nr:hypothetical protein [Planctomycetaceae bacterium]